MTDKHRKDLINLTPDSLRTVSSSPHVKSEYTVTSVMGDVMLALCPALAWGVYVFGLRALTITLASVISCMAFEALYQFIMKKEIAVRDLSAAVTGMLLAFNLPVNVPVWFPVAGGAFAIIIVKQLFGGIGKNIVNPAIAARIFLFISFPNLLSSYIDITLDKLSPFSMSVDAVASATPLTFLKNGELPETGIFDMVIGNKSGCIGEVSAVLLILGGIYLIIRKVISWHIPVSFIITVAALTYIFPKNPDSLNFMLYELTSGGLVLGAVFMATDYVTCPITKYGRLIFGTGCGLITVFIRYFGGYPEGISFAIMIMNLFVWYIDKLTKPKKFGGKGIERK